MAEKTNISWADHSWNGWIGCTKVSEACKFCYAERDWDMRFHRVQWGPAGNRVLTGPENWRQPLRWDRAAKAAGVRRRVFCNSLSDVFDDHESIDPIWRQWLYDLWASTSNLEWLVLTKRPDNWAKLLPSLERPMANVRLGVSIETQERADERGPYLQVAHNLGWPTFVSNEPALGPVNWDPLMPYIGWLISGGESGPYARQTPPAIFRAARDACARHGVPFHFKQWGEWAYEGQRDANGQMLIFDIDTESVHRLGRVRAGRRLDGMIHDAIP